MMKKNIFACMNEDTILYTVGLYKNHAFRLYPDGSIKKADEQETNLALSFLSRN